MTAAEFADLSVKVLSDMRNWIAEASKDGSADEGTQKPNTSRSCEKKEVATTGSATGT